jgi:hypothetical protein
MVMISHETVERGDLEPRGESWATDAFVEDAEHHRPRRRRHLLIALIVTAAILIAAIVAIVGGGLGGNGSRGPASPPVAVGSGQVTGVLMLEAGVSAAGTHPLPGTVVLQSNNGKTFWMHVGSDGSFKFQVPPGTYTATGQSPNYISNFARALCLSHGYVVVRAGETTTTTVVCEGM